MPHPTRPERVAHARVRDVPLESGLLALVTLDDDRTGPTTLGSAGIAELADALRTLDERAHREEIVAVAVTGKPGCFVAGADLMQTADVRTWDQARALGRDGHAAYRLLRELPVPTFAFVNGIALGGGLELALHCDHRTVADDVRALGLPETGLGLVPGWGGSTLLPRLVGVRAALDVILDRAASGRHLDAEAAAALGLVDAVLDPDGFLEASLGWTQAVLHGELVTARRPLDGAEEWERECAAARERLDAVVHGAREAPYRALDLVAAARTATPQEAAEAETEALAALIMGDEMRASVYAFSLVQEAKHAPDAPSADLARPVRRVGIVGAGLMAAQIAVLTARRLGVGVVMRDLDDERTAAGLAAVRQAAERLVASGRLDADEAARLVDSVSATTELADLADCDLVIEAVTELLDVKRRVFAELEEVVDPSAVLATNTSALSVTAMAEGLRHPDRVVGLHFFNPVASMPLVEVAHTRWTSPEALATAFAVAAGLGKLPVGVADRPGFVVNRLLVLLLGMVADAVERGTPVEVADRALDPMALPMPPFELFDLVGPGVALHVLRSLRADLGERFPASPGLERIVAEGLGIVQDAGRGRPRRVDPAVQAAFGPATGGADEAGVLDAVLDALTGEIGLMLAEGVVDDVRRIDLCLLLGAGWGRHLGGIAPYLDRTGYSERVLGRRLLPEGEANAPG